MNDAALSAFPPGVAEEIKFYVYRLYDPRNGETFYVGKGVGNRVFSHANGESVILAEDEDALGANFSRIREIRLSGFNVGHVIHRHGMNEETAFEVEAALIEAYPGLTNEVAGHYSGDRGVMHAREIVERYAAEPACFDGVKAILITISREVTRQDTYESVRFAWRMSVRKAEQAEYVMAVQNGLIVGVYVPQCWLEATSEHFPGRASVPGRIGFSGMPADEKEARKYLRKCVPFEMRGKRGAANPVRYTW